MTGRTRAERDSTMGGLHLEASRLRIFCLVVAIAATGALIITLAVGMPGQVRGPGPNGMPPPPPDLRPLANITIVTGLFVLAWLAALVVYCRDQIMQRLGEMEDRSTTEPEPATQRIAELFTGLRAELAADRERELTELSEQIAAMTSEYGEQRETDGYLNGMRVATAGNQPPEQKLRAVRRTSPPA
jgi:hypothetical protein